LRGVKTLNGGPRRASGKRVVHFGGVFEVTQAGFEQIFLRGGVTARRFTSDEALRFLRRDAKVEDEIFAGKAVDFVFEVLDPFQEFGALRWRDAGGLVRQIGADVAVDKNNLAAVERGLQFEYKDGEESAQGGDE